MKLYPIDSIIIAPDRQRKEVDPEFVQELAESIENGQLQNAPVVRDSPLGPVLVSGETRMLAMQSIWDLDGDFSFDGQLVPRGMVPTNTLGELTELEAEEAELDENLRRRDLSWQDLAEVHARLHKLRQAQNPKTVTLSSESDPTDPDLNKTVVVGSTHTVADTAREIHGRADGAFQDTVRKEIIVAKHLSNPEVAKAKTLDDAFKVLKREEERQRNVALGLEVGKTFNADIHEVFNESCLNWMSRASAAEQFDVILTDPPYGMGAHEFGDAGGKMTGIEHHYDDSYESWRRRMGGTFLTSDGKLVDSIPGWCALSYRVAKPQAHAYVFCDFDRFHELKLYMEQAGWYVFRTPLIVFKQNSGRVPRPQHGPRRQYEIILYAIKGDKQVTHIYPDVIQVTADENLSHGAQKPVALYQNLLQRSVKPGDVILDSFGGTGTLLPAAHGFQCKAVVVEQSPEYYALCVKRARELKQLEQPGLF